MDLKQLSIDIKDMDDAKGVIIAYANTYNFKDSDGDISAYGSFDKTVAENFKRIRVLKDHNPTMMVGVPLVIDTKDSYGLLTTTQFNLNKPLAKDLYTDIKLMTENNLSAELSIGYKVIQRDVKNKSIINEYKLMEYSFLSSWGANELSTVQGIKSIKSHYGILELIEKSYNLDYSDERLRGIESLLKMAQMEMDGEDNDSKFINMMIPHHEAAIKMAKKYESLLKNNTLVKMSKDIITSQSKEIEIMKALSKKSLETDTLNEQPLIEQIKSFRKSLIVN